MNVKKFVCFLFVLLLTVNKIVCYNILVVYGHPGKSHYDVFEAMFRVLAERGHNLTILSHVNSPHHKNIRHILFRDTEPVVHEVSIAESRRGGFSYMVDQLILLSRFGSWNCKHDLQSPQFQSFLKEEHKYDLMIGEMFNTVCYDGLATKYNVPFVGLSSCDYMPWHNGFFGIPFNTAYMPNILSDMRAPFTFLARVQNTVTHLVSLLWFQRYLYKEGQELSRRYIGYESADPYKASLLLVNIHHTLNGVTALPPNVIEVAGIHVVNKKPKKLPQDVADWINNSDQGVIYFSLGSMIKGHTFPEEQRRAFIRAFAKLPQRILWKWENDTMPDKPDNVMISKWMPQLDILSHPNVKVFISHGGMLGTIEAIYNGKPIVVIPQFGDQAHNARKLERKGVGVFLDMRDATEEAINAALAKALDSEMVEKVKSVSEQFRDRPMSPMDSAVYWVEHVAKHQGGLYMRSEAIDVPFYQYYLIDVAAFLVSIIAVCLFTLCKIVKLILKLTAVFSKNAKQKNL